MRMSGSVIGARPRTATRISVIFSSDGFELVLTFPWYASMVSSAQNVAAAAPAAARRNERRGDFLRVDALIYSPLNDQDRPFYQWAEDLRRCDILRSPFSSNTIKEQHFPLCESAFL